MTFKTDPVGTPSRVDNILAASLEEHDSDIEDIVSHVIGRWRAYWDDITGNKLIDVVRVSTAAESAFGRQEREVEIFIYYKRTDVEDELDFWKTRWARVFREVSFSGFLDALKLLPGDWIAVTYTDAYGSSLYSAKGMELLRTEDQGDEGLVNIKARWAAFTY